tara:strand:- start:1087 stop:1872 length:786 start_codon:yes stop_codon:yes gene_type:complete
MAKYRNAYRDTLDEPVEEVQATEQPKEAPKAPLNAEEETFKKRYGDLRRHMQQQMVQRDQEMEQVKQQLADATKAQIKFPKTEEEVEAWSKKYPDVAKIVDTIAQKRVQEAVTDAKMEFEEIKKQQRGIQTEKALMELKRLHPDFDAIRATKEFHNWVDEQPRNVRDALYKNNTDARAAARALDLYKADKGMRRKSSKNVQAAAQAVSKRGGVTAPTGGRPTFKESQVQNMSPSEYEKNEDAIMESIKKGLFDYDVTGGAR